jgi:DNA-binding MarR family transcriptional regulator
MNNDECQWVALPYFLFIGKQLKYQDALIYIAIRSFLNVGTGDCFPTYEKIALKAGVSRNFLVNSIKRLKGNGMLDYTTSKASRNRNNSNRYSIEKIDTFDQIPLSFFDLKDLTYPEKSMLLCIRQFFVHGWLTTMYTMKQMSHFIGISYKTLYSQFIKLIDKGYVQKVVKGKKHKIAFYELTDRVDWITGQTRPSGITSDFKFSLKVG